MSAYDPGVADKPVIALNVDAIDDDVLAAAGLRAGQPVVAEPTDGGVLLRPATDAEVAEARRVSAADADDVLARYPQTIRRLGQ